jgi:hypothetical protein
VKGGTDFSLPDGPTKTAALVAWVQGLFSDQDGVPVLVGGAAVEILTGGAYTTGDLDFAGSIPSSVKETLLKSGFEPSGRHWIHQDAQIFLEFPSETLDSRERSVRISIYGFDLLIGRVGLGPPARSQLVGQGPPYDEFAANQLLPEPPG